MKLDANKLKGLKSFDSYLDEQYGGENSVERKEFESWELKLIPHIHLPEDI